MKTKTTRHIQQTIKRKTLTYTIASRISEIHFTSFFLLLCARSYSAYFTLNVQLAKLNQVDLTWLSLDCYFVFFSIL